MRSELINDRLILDASYDHENVIRFSDRRTGLEAIVAIHRTIGGIAMGGTRLWPYGDETEALTDALRLSAAMTRKAASAGLPVGGAKVVVIGAPSIKNEAYLRTYARFINGLRGLVVTGQDLNVTMSDVALMAEETPFIVGCESRICEPALMTARGVLEGLRGALRARFNAPGFAGVRVAIQGVGEVGARLAAMLAAEGAELTVADFDELRARRVAAATGAVVLPAESILGADVDVLAPCGRGQVLSRSAISTLKAAVVGGAANNQLKNGEVDAALLHERHIAYCPDFVISAGGLIEAFRELSGLPEEVSQRQVLEIGSTVQRILEQSALENRPTTQVAEEFAAQRFETLKADAVTNGLSDRANQRLRAWRSRNGGQDFWSGSLPAASHRIA